MPKKRYNAKEIIQKLRGADVLLSQGKTVSQACKQLGVSDQTYTRWRKIPGEGPGSGCDTASLTRTWVRNAA